MPSISSSLPRPECNTNPPTSLPSSSSNQPSPQPPTCAHILPKKQRRCRMPVKPGATLCVAHDTSLPACPACGTRLPTPGALRKHVETPLCPTLCKRRRTQSQPFFQPGVNAVPPSLPHDHLSSPTVAASSSSDRRKDVGYAVQERDYDESTHDETHVLARAILSRLSAIPPLQNPPDLPQASAILSAWTDERDSTFKYERKHFPQIAALATRLLHSPPFPPSLTSPAVDDRTPAVAVVDLAAGRAYTALYVSHALRLQQIPHHVVVVDRASTRHKADRTLRSFLRPPASSIAPNNYNSDTATDSDLPASSLLSFRRLTIDLQNLSLTGLPECTNSPDIRLIGKHLCGAALDLALTAATSFAHSQRRQPGSVTLVFASCCRRLCARPLFGGAAAEWQRLGVTDGELDRMLAAAHWGLDVAHSTKMAKIGDDCRRVVDGMRVSWLNSVGWRAYLGTYTNVSPENACIYATWEGCPRNS